MIRRAWRARWRVARLLLACGLLWAVVIDTGPRLARLGLAALPGYDYAGAADALRAQGRFGEALEVIDAGLDEQSGADDGARNGLASLRRRTLDEQSSWLRRARDLGLGALSGQGHSLERLLGAVGADFFIVGDVRDLVIQGVKQAVDGDSDELILLLSAVGVATTLAPELDWAPSLLKAARKAGALPRRIGDELVAMVRGGRKAEAAAVVGDVATLAKRASPGGALKLLRLAESPGELRTMARFVERRPRGAFALGVTGRAGMDTLIEAGDGADKLVLKAATKGERGASWLRTPGARVLLRPHALVGVAKGLWKGTLAEAVARALEAMDARAWWVIPLLACWVLLEAGLTAQGLMGRRSPTASAPGR